MAAFRAATAKRRARSWVTSIDQDAGEGKVPEVPDVHVEGLGAADEEHDNVDQQTNGDDPDATVPPKAMAAAAGQPTSTMFRWTPVRVTIAWKRPPGRFLTCR